MKKLTIVVVLYSPLGSFVYFCLMIQFFMAMGESLVLFERQLNCAAISCQGKFAWKYPISWAKLFATYRLS